MTPSPRLALLSIDPTWEDPSGDFAPFTYGVRKLEASIRSDAELGDVETRVIDLRSSDPDAFFEAIVDFRPTMIGASLYLWSIGPFQELARRVRAWDPTVRIVVGGPQARRSVFELAPYRSLARHVDAAVPGEGEEILRTLLKRPREGWDDVPGLLLPSALGWRSTGSAERPVLDAYPSPYQLGIAPRERTGYIETFRGCPIHCNFCQWGEQRADRVHGTDYLRRHLLGLREASVPNVFFLDAAFNLSPRAFRNLAEAEREVGVLRATTVHGHLYPTFLTDAHLELLQTFGRTQVSIGVQSFEPDVLSRLGRPFDVERFESVIEAIRPSFSIDLELMLGLPGDDPVSFRRTFDRAVEIGDTVRVFRTLVLPDALLERAEALSIDFDLETFLIRSCAGWTPSDLERELDYVRSVAATQERPILAESWVGFAVRGRDRREPSRSDLPDAVLARLQQRIAAEVVGWTLRGAAHADGALTFDLGSPSGDVVLEAIGRAATARFFELRDDVAYSHRGPIERGELPSLGRVIDIVHTTARPLVIG